MVLFSEDIYRKPIVEEELKLYAAQCSPVRQKN